MGDHLRMGIARWYVTSHPANLASCPQQDEMSTGQSVVMLCGCEQMQDGSFHSWINVWVAGKTVISR